MDEEYSKYLNNNNDDDEKYLEESKDFFISSSPRLSPNDGSEDVDEGVEADPYFNDVCTIPQQYETPVSRL